MNERPLHGVRVLEMGSSIAGPFCCRILADLGAEVIKVEPPDSGDPAREWGAARLGGTSATFQAMNAGKRSIEVDFARPEELERLRRLIAKTVDVVVQNLRPGVADRIGLGPTGAMALNPRLVYCNLSAFGRDGPLAGQPGYDPLIQAFAGLADVTGPADGEPARVGVPIIDMGTGLWSTIGVLAALHTRTRTGGGCVVDAAMFDTALSWQSIFAATLEAGGAPPRRSGLRGPLIVPNNAFRTADGLLLITVGTDRQFAHLAQAIGKPELATDPRFRDNGARMANEDALTAALESALACGTREHWSQRLLAADVPSAPLQSLAEALDHEQTAASGMLVRAPGSGFSVVGHALRFDGERPAFERSAPALGEANEEIFSELE